MRWGHVDTERAFISIPDSKNGEARDIPINSRLHDILAAISHEIVPGGFVFINKRTRKPYTAGRASHAFQQAVATAEVVKEGQESVTLHTLRHTVAWRLRKAEVQELKIAMILGHSVENNITARYGRPQSEELRSAVEALVVLRNRVILGTEGAPAKKGSV